MAGTTGNFFKACSDQTRLRLLNLLAVEGEVCVYFLVAVLETNQPKISRHLAYLKNAGLVETRKQGLWVHYRLASELSGQTQRMLECLSSCCGEIEELNQDVRRLRLIRDERVGIVESEQDSSLEETYQRSEPIEIELL